MITEIASSLSEVKTEIAGCRSRGPRDSGLTDLVAQFEAGRPRVLEQRHVHTGDSGQDRVAEADSLYERSITAPGGLAVPDVQSVEIVGEELHRLAPVVPLVVRHLADGGSEHAGGFPSHDGDEQAAGAHILPVLSRNGPARGDPRTLGRLEKGEPGR